MKPQTNMYLTSLNRVTGRKTWYSSVLGMVESKKFEWHGFLRNYIYSPLQVSSHMNLLDVQHCLPVISWNSMEINWRVFKYSEMSLQQNSISNRFPLSSLLNFLFQHQLFLSKIKSSICRSRCHLPSIVSISPSLFYSEEGDMWVVVWAASQFNSDSFTIGYTPCTQDQKNISVETGFHFNPGCILDTVYWIIYIFTIILLW